MLKKTKFNFFSPTALTLGCFLLLLLAYKIEIPTSADDYSDHLIWTKAFYHEFLKGNLYPRWLYDLNNGLGAPIFYYYPPLPYFFSLLFFKLGFPAVKVLALVSAASIILSFLSFRLWASTYFKDYSLIFASLFYTFSAYHFGIDLAFRCAFTELFSFIFIPLILYSIDTINLQKDSLKILHGSLLSLSVSGLLLSHLPMSVVYFPLVTWYFLALTFRKDNIFKFNKYIFISIFGILGIALSSIYILPALKLREEVQLSNMYTHFHKYSDSFLFSDLQTGHFSANSIFTFSALLCLAHFVLYLIMPQIKKTNKPNEYEVVKNTMMVFSITYFLLMLKISDGLVWSNLHILQTIQFPWRITGVLTLAGAFFSGIVVEKSAYLRNRPKLLIRSLAATPLIISVLLPLSTRFRSHNMDDWNNFRLEFLVSPPEYFRSDILDPYMEIKENSKSNFIMGNFSKISDVTRLNESTNFTIVTTNDPTEIVFSQFFYPGFYLRKTAQGDFNHAPDEFTLSQVPKTGLIRASLPKGTFNLEFGRKKLLIEKTAEKISIFAVLLLLLTVIISIVKSGHIYRR